MTTTSDRPDLSAGPTPPLGPRPRRRLVPRRRSPLPHPSGRGPAFAAALLSAVAAAAVTAVVVAAPEADDRLASAFRRDPRAIVVVVPAERAARTPVTITVTLSARPVTLPAPSWAGTITALPVAPGATLGVGDPVVAVDGVQRLYATGPSPFWRPLGWGATGADVSSLSALLDALGVGTTWADPATFGDGHAIGVEALRARIGAPPGTTFEPAFVLWSPTPTFAVGEVAAQLGAPAPPPGVAVATAGRDVVTAVATAPDGVARPIEELHAATLRIGTTTSPAEDPHRLAVLGALASAAAKGPTPTVELVGTREEPLRRGLAAVPAGAVLTGSDGGRCVIAASGGATAVEVVDSAAGATYVAGLDRGTALPVEVVANPASSGGPLRCP